MSPEYSIVNEENVGFLLNRTGAGSNSNRPVLDPCLFNLICCEIRVPGLVVGKLIVSFPDHNFAVENNHGKLQVESAGFSRRLWSVNEILASPLAFKGQMPYSYVHRQMACYSSYDCNFKQAKVVALNQL